MNLEKLLQLSINSIFSGAEKMEEEKPKNTLQFTEGVIVKVTSKEPMNPKEIKVVKESVLGRSMKWSLSRSLVKY